METLAPLLATVAIAGCGRWHFDARATGDGNGDDIGAVPDAGCKGTGPWGALTRIDELSMTPNTEYGGQISGDGLTLYFDSHVTGDQELYVARRAARTATFDPATRIVELGSPATDSNASLTGDGLELWFDSDRTGSACVFVATRATTADSWGVPVRQDQLCLANQIVGPYITPDGLSLLYNTVVDGHGEGDLGIAERATRGATFPPGASLGLSGGNGFGVLSRDRLTIYFESTVGVRIELHQATRATTAAAFGPITPIAELDTIANNEDVSVTDDEAELFFASDRAAGDTDLWRASRPCQ